MFLSIVRTPENRYFINLKTDEEAPTVAAHKTLEDALHYWESPRQRALSRGSEGGASAIIHSILFDPSIVEFSDIREFLSSVGVSGDTEMRRFVNNTVVGTVSGLWIPTRGGAKAWRSGTKTRLI